MPTSPFHNQADVDAYLARHSDTPQHRAAAQQYVNNHPFTPPPPPPPPTPTGGVRPTTASTSTAQPAANTPVSAARTTAAVAPQQTTAATPVNAAPSTAASGGPFQTPEDVAAYLLRHSDTAAHRAAAERYVANHPVGGNAPPPLNVYRDQINTFLGQRDAANAQVSTLQTQVTDLRNRSSITGLVDSQGHPAGTLGNSSVFIPTGTGQAIDSSGAVTDIAGTPASGGSIIPVVATIAGALAFLK